MIANYPPFYPLIYHDINLDIPPQHQSLCKTAYRSWQFFICIGVLLDLICSVIIVSTTDVVFLNFFWYKLIYFFTIPLAAFICLYFPLYKALKQNHQFYWIIHAAAAFLWLVYLTLSMIGTVWKKDGTTWVSNLSNFYAFPGGESGFYGVAYFFEVHAYTAGIAGLVARLWWMVTLIFYIVHARFVYQTYNGGLSTQTKIGANKESESAELGQIDRSRGQVGGVVNVNGRDVNVSVDTKTATSVATKAYTSGAAAQLAKGAKVDKNGDVIVDPHSAMTAAKTMHSTGATSELAAGMTVSSGGYSVGPATAEKGQYVRAIHDFAGGEQGDLPLRQGDRVLIVRRIDANWYEGSFNGKTGIFPTKFVTNA